MIPLKRHLMDDVAWGRREIEIDVQVNTLALPDPPPQRDAAATSQNHFLKNYPTRTTKISVFISFQRHQRSNEPNSPSKFICFPAFRQSASECSTDVPARRSAKGRLVAANFTCLMVSWGDNNVWRKGTKSSKSRFGAPLKPPQRQGSWLVLPHWSLLRNDD